MQARAAFVGSTRLTAQQSLEIGLNARLGTNRDLRPGQARAEACGE